jgi:hypothetical protein
VPGAVGFDICPPEIVPPAIPQLLSPPGVHWLCLNTLAVNTKALVAGPFEKVVAPLWKPVLWVNVIFCGPLLLLPVKLMR